MPSFTKQFTLTAQATTVQPGLGVHLGNGLFANNSNPYSSLRAHYDGFNTAMGRTATIIPAVGANDTASFPAGAAPNTWGGGDSGNWVGQAQLPTDGNTFPQLTWAFSDGSVDNNFALFAPGTGGLPTTIFAGQTMDHWIQANLQPWRNVAPFKKIYIRVNWEFNQGGPNPPTTVFNLTSSGQVAAWLNAWRGFCNSAHTWGNANSCQVRMCWCPTTPNGVANSAMTFGLPVANFFPLPDGNAVNGRYIDVVCPDVYAIATSFGFTGANTVWCFDNYVKLAQQGNCNIGIAELGDFLNQTAWQNWIPNDFTPYLNNLKNLTPAVPIEVCSLYDITGIGQAFCFSVLDPNGNNDCHAWRIALGNGAAIITIPPI